MASKMTAPRRKEEYVKAIQARTSVSDVDLRKHDVERLKQIWSMVRPKKASPPLPVGWKKLDVAALKQIYEEQVRVDLDRPNDSHWIRWHRPQLVSEIAMWAAEIEEEIKDGPEDLFYDSPLCSECRIPMIVRTNRVTKTDFYGCIRFPVCTQTLPLQYAGMPTKKAQEALNPVPKEPILDFSKDKSSRTGKGHGYGRGSTLPKRSSKGLLDERGESSDGSWIQTGPRPVDDSTETDDEKKVYNANVTEEELKMLLEIRRAKEEGKP